jgi:amino acid transporter
VGKSVQNLLSAVKILGLIGIFVAAATCSTRGSWATSGPMEEASLGLALVFVLYAYGGWNDTAFVAAEVRGQRRNLPLALFLGIGLITAIYLLVILAYLFVLGFEGAQQSATPAADVMQVVMGDWGRSIISGLVMVSALGAINGLILTGSRVYASLGADHSLFARLSRWDVQRGAPATALVVQGLIALLLVLAVGTAAGRQLIDATLQLLGRRALPWEEYFGGFETLVSGTAPVFWGFFLLTGISLFVLRIRDRQRPRPFTTPFFPLPPIIFCGMCGYMLYSSLTYAKGLAILGLLPLAVGLPLYAISLWRDRRS